jgi:hypothetical protein
MRTLGEVAETIVKIAVPAAVFGYMGLRAHLNRIGIPATETLGLERYLNETYLFLTALLAPVVVVVAAISLILSVRHRMLRRRRRHASAPGAVSLWLDRNQPALLLTVLGLSYVLLLRRLSMTWPDQDIAVGPLVQSRLESPTGWWTLTWLVFVCVSAGLLIRWPQTQGSEKSTVRTPLAIRLGIVLWIILALHVPLVYGWTVRGASYPVVRLDLKEPDEHACGLLVIETSDDVRIWTAEKGRGVVLRVPRTRVLRIIAGAVEDLTMDAGLVASGTRDSAPACP